MKELTLRTFWLHKSYTIEEFAKNAKEYLQLLNKINPLFSNLIILANGLDKTHIADDYSNFEELFYKGAYDKELVYTHLDNKDLLTDKSIGPFFITFSNRRKYSDDQFQITFTVNGSNLDENQQESVKSFLQFDFPENDPSFFELEFCRNLLQETADFWKAKYAHIYTFDFKKKIKSPDSSFGSIGWLNYFPNKRVLDYVAIKDVNSISTSSNGSCLIALTSEMPDSDNQADLYKAIHIRDKLLPTGLLNW